jgi:hypothetical protein
MAPTQFPHYSISSILVDLTGLNRVVATLAVVLQVLFF